MRWWRVLIGLGLIADGATQAVLTITVTAHDDDPYAAMSTAGSSAILVAVGLATLAPLVLRLSSRALAPIVGRRGVGGWLAAATSTRRPQLLAGVLAPVIVLVGGSVGVLMMVGIDHRTIGAASTEGDTINLLNNLVTGMVALFAAIMVVNTFAAVVAGRRNEFEQLRLVGATRSETEGSVMAEAGMVAAVGVVFGLLASLATVVPFSIARDEGIVPDGQLWLPPLLVVAVVAITLGSARLAVARAHLDTARLGAGA